MKDYSLQHYAVRELFGSKPYPSVVLQEEFFHMELLGVKKKEVSLAGLGMLLMAMDGRGSREFGVLSKQIINAMESLNWGQVRKNFFTT